MSGEYGRNKFTLLSNNDDGAAAGSRGVAGGNEEQQFYREATSIKVKGANSVNKYATSTP